MANTPNYNLKKVEYTEIADIPGHFNGNMDMIDTTLKAHEDELATKETPAGAQAKADAAESAAKTYADQEVGDLAGAGRTTETVKENADALAAHKADYTKYGFGNRPYTVSYSTIYIDEANGDDTNDGLSEQTAVKTPNRLIQLIPIFLQNTNFTIKIIGNLSAILVIPTVLLFHSSGASRRLIVEGITQNKENHELSSGIRAYAVQCILEIRHVNVIANAVVCSACTYVEINNVSSSLDTSSAMPIAADNGTNMYISNSEVNNPSGSCIVSYRLSVILSRDNTGSGAYGLYAHSGGDIIKYGTTQPTGTTSDEREFGGGVVR